MGILRSGLLGPFRKKTGSVIGRQRRGQNVMTGLHETSNKPPSERQLEERLKFGLLNSFLSKIESLVEPGFKRYAGVKTALNVAYSFNVKHAFVKTGVEWELNFPEMVYSRGPVDTPEGAAVVLTDALSGAPAIAFSWLAQKQSASCQYTDLASFLVYNAAKDQAVIIRKGVNRYAAAYNLGLPADFAGDTLHCYMNFDAADGKRVGDSLYIGALLV